MDDEFGLQRFVIAQDQGDMYGIASSELRAGRKSSHWMWFVFPQVAGLGHSPMSKTYAISSLDEARAYLSHPVLGPRLIECAGILTQLSDRSALDIFGPVDAEKLRSSMTLFAIAAPHESIFEGLLAQYFEGSRDARTGQLLCA